MLKGECFIKIIVLWNTAEKREVTPGTGAGIVPTGLLQIMK
jgi:hypothetical protein